MTTGTLSAAIGSGSGIVPRGLINGASVFASQENGAGAISNIPVAVVTTPAVSANVLTNIFSATGRGALGFLSVQNFSGTTHTERLKVTLDGIVIFDGTSPNTASTAIVYTVIGQLIGTSAPWALIPEYIQFNSSILIQYACSTAETSSAKVAYRYIPR